MPPSAWYPFDQPRSWIHDSGENFARVDDEHNSVPKWALVTSNEADRPSISTLKGLGVNLATLLRETLYVLQDGITAELQARESHSLQVFSEQKINMEQLSLQHDELVSQNQQLVKVIDDACQSVPELAIPADIPAETKIHKLATGVREAREEMTKVLLELNLHIAKLRLKTQPSTPPKVREQRASTIAVGLQEIGGVVRDCTNMLE